MRYTRKLLLLASLLAALVSAQAPGDIAPAETAAPGNVVAQFNLGRDYFAKGDLEQAGVQFEAALKLRPDYMPARLALTQLALRRGDPDLALKYAREILKLNPNSGVATLLEAAALVRKAQYDEARALLDKILKANPDQVDALLELGVLNLTQKRYKDAEEPFRRAYALDRSNLRGLLGLAEIHFGQNEPDKAVQVIAEEQEKQPQQSDLRKELANAEFRAKRYERAIADYQSILDQYKDTPLEQADLYARIGTAYATLGSHPRAIENLQKARQLSPSNVGYVATLAQFYENSGKQQEALAAYRDAMKIDPDTGVVLNNLAYLLTRTGGDLDEALTLANKARQQLPNLNEVSDTIGIIYIKKHMNDAAIEIFRDLTNKVKDNSTFHYHYGMALAQKGDKAGALQELNVALQCKPDNNEENEIKELIQELSKIQ